MSVAASPHLPFVFTLLALGAAIVAGAAGAAGGAELRRHPGKNPELPFSGAVELGDLVYLSGALALTDGGAGAQTRATLDQLEAQLAALGLDLSRVVEARVYLPDIRVFPAVDAEIGRRFGQAPPTMAVVEAALVVPGAEVEIAVVAARRGVTIEPLLPAGWSEPKAHFRRALKVGGTLFVSGQVGVDPKTKETVSGGLAAQARQAFANLEALLAAGGLGRGDVTSCRVFLADARDFGAMNEVWREFFPEDPPVRETLQGKLTDPELRIEIHCQASAGGRRVIERGPATQPYSTIVAGGGRVFTSGIVARTPDGFEKGGAAAQTRFILNRLGGILEKAGLGPDDVADATVALADPRYFPELNEEYRKFFPGGLPTRVTAALPLMSPEGLVEISFVACEKPPAPAP